MSTAPAARRIVERAVKVAAEAHDLPPEAVVAPQGGPARRARLLAHYLAVVGGNQPLKRVTAVTGHDPNTVRRALGRIETRREDPRFDAWLSRLERRIA